MKLPQPRCPSLERWCACRPIPHPQLLHMRFPMSALPVGTNEFTLTSKTYFGNGPASKPFNATRTVRRAVASTAWVCQHARWRAAVASGPHVGG